MRSCVVIVCLLPFVANSQIEPVAPSDLPSNYQTKGDGRIITFRMRNNMPEHTCSSLQDPWHCDDHTGGNVFTAATYKCLRCEKYTEPRPRPHVAWETYFCDVNGSSVAHVQYSEKDCQGTGWMSTQSDTSFRKDSPRCRLDCNNGDIGFNCDGCSDFTTGARVRTMKPYLDWFEVVDPLYQCNTTIGQCVLVGDGTPGASHYSQCRSSCLPTTTTTTTIPRYACVDNQCVRSSKGATTLDDCRAVCDPIVVSIAV